VDLPNGTGPPSSCLLHDGIITAQGTLKNLETPVPNEPGVLPDGYLRFGDVVELYAYTTTGGPATGVQVLDLTSETTGNLFSGSNSWTVSAPVASGDPQPQSCFVAIQSTHAFMGAPSAGF